MTMNMELLNRTEQERDLIMDDKIKEYLLEEYSIEPFPVVWTEQYLVQEIYRITDLYERGEWKPVPRSAYERLLVCYEGLKRDYLDAVYDIQILCGLVEEFWGNK